MSFHDYEHTRGDPYRNPYAPPGAGANDWERTTGHSRGGWGGRIAAVFLVVMIAFILIAALGGDESNTAEGPAALDGPTMELGANPATDPAINPNTVPATPAETQTPAEPAPTE